MRQAQRVSPLCDGSWRGKRTEAAGNNTGDPAQQGTATLKHDKQAEGATHGAEGCADDKYAPSPGHLKDLRKRAGACRWTQKLCRVLELYLSQLPDAANGKVRAECVSMGAQASMLEEADEPHLHWELALAIWDTILKCDDDAKGVLKEKAKQARTKEKKARKKNKGKGRR